GRTTMEIIETKNRIRRLLPRISAIARRYGHSYRKGLMVAKNWVVLSVKQLFGIKSDEKLSDFVWETGIAQESGYRRKPNPSLFAKARKYAKDGALVLIYDELVREFYRGRQLRLIGEDSTDMSAFFTKKDMEARLGHRTQKRREQQLNEMTGKDRKEKAFVLGYKLHLIEDCEIGLPLTGVVKTAEVHDSRPFYELFPYVVDNFNVQYGAKFLGDSAYDSADIRKKVREVNSMTDVIAVNGRGHYPSETPKDNEYGKRWFLEQTNSVLETTYNLASNRMKGIKKMTVHAFACLIANFMEHFME
ncbi:transposase, partial [Candidatus Marsarchaeota archaeon]|nr:transposase [Candidatus Marsarchaeota archaeon]